MTNHYIYFPAGWTRRPKLNIPESINKRIRDEKNRAILSRVFKRIGREPYQTVRVTRKNLKNLKNLRTVLSKIGDNVSEINAALRVLEPNYNRKLAAVKKIETAYKRYIRKHRNNEARRRLLNKSKAVSKLVGTVAAKRLATRHLARRAATAYTANWNRIMAELNGTRPKTNAGKNKYEQAKIYKNRIVHWAYTHPKKYDRTLYRGVQDKEALMFLTQSSVKKPNLSSFSKKLRETKFFSYSTPSSLNINSNLKRISVILRYSPTSAIPSLNYTSNFHSRLGSEDEVLLMPGTFVVKNRVYETRDTIVIDVDYIPA